MKFYLLGITCHMNLLNPHGIKTAVWSEGGRICGEEFSKEVVDLTS